MAYHAEPKAKHDRPGGWWARAHWFLWLVLSDFPLAIFLP